MKFHEMHEMDRQAQDPGFSSMRLWWEDAELGNGNMLVFGEFGRGREVLEVLDG